MNNLFSKLAFSGIAKNKKLYFPYIISCITSVTIYYIIDYLSVSPTVKSIHGGANLTLILSMGKFVITAFIVLFLLYSNSFLSRRRNKEFGLYNILGMDKKAIIKVIINESLIVMIISLILGCLLGIAFSKLAEMALLYISKAENNFSFTLSFSSLRFTLIIFALIFAVLTVKSIISVLRSDILSLINSEKSGEKPIKANWILAAIGFVLLACAYAISVIIKSPLSAVQFFQFAVIMVIIATYMLFISGSVAICKLLQKNKNYYYKKNHFISVSSMVYRMKRNGAGLASICILSTMVLVMIASSASLYFGEAQAISARFPQQNQIELYYNSLESFNESNINSAKEKYINVFKKYNAKPKNEFEFTYCSITALNTKSNTFDADASKYIDSFFISDNIRTLYFMPVSSYNQTMNTDYKLSNNEALVFTNGCNYNETTLKLSDVDLNIIGKLEALPKLGTINRVAVGTIFLLIPDLNILAPLDKMVDYNNEKMLSIAYYYGYDIDVSDETAIDILNEQTSSVKSESYLAQENTWQYTANCQASEKSDFSTTFGGLFFIGIFLSVIFIFAMAMIIYYKQISEGYEDAHRFDIMKKVGMSKRDIKKNVNSQILTVFFAPLVFAGIHFSFAFPAIWKLLQLFRLSNLPFVILISFISFIVFGIFYSLIYKLTAKSYLSIVTNDN